VVNDALLQLAAAFKSTHLNLAISIEIPEDSLRLYFSDLTIIKRNAQIAIVLLKLILKHY
jgi:hypothetical protein